MPINKTYDTWFRRICELRPSQRITQIRSFVWLLIGIYLSRSVNLSRVANKIPGKAKLLSNVRRLSRLLDNPAIRVREWYESTAIQWLTAQFHNLGEIRLIVDGTRIGSGHQLLMVGLAYRKRAIPIAWTWVKQVRGHSGAGKQLALLAYVRKLIPTNAVVFLVGDCEFGAVEVLRQLDKWHWFYVLRQKSDTCVWFNNLNDWKPFSSFVPESCCSVWLGYGYLPLMPTTPPVIKPAPTSVPSPVSPSSLLPPTTSPITGWAGVPSVPGSPPRLRFTSPASTHILPYNGATQVTIETLEFLLISISAD